MKREILVEYVSTFQKNTVRFVYLVILGGLNFTRKYVKHIRRRCPHFKHNSKQVLGIKYVNARRDRQRDRLIRR